MNRWHGLVLSLLLAILCLAPAASAQVEGPHLGFSAQGGGNFWTGGKPLENDLIYGGRLALMPWSRVGVEGTIELHPTQRAGGNDFRVTHLSADAIVEILPFHRLNPYLTAGLTRLHVDDLGAGEENWNGWEIGGGLLVALANAEGRQVDLRLDLRRVVSERKNAGPNDDNFPTNWIATLGLRFALGANPADGDADGVPDRSDRCPGTPRMALVDQYGCPTDGDNDGVFDGLDRCPDTPQGAKVDEEGCPIDSDGDGVYDLLDRCPDTAPGVPVDEMGCALDADQDGVPDGIDRCPDTKEGEQVDKWGCEVDNDGDGVPDRIDRCPGTPPNIAVDERGCPIPQSAREIQLLDTGLLRLNNVHFESAKAEIKPESYPALTDVAKILVKWPSLRIEIGGHTDSQGSAEFNQKLSEARAQAVFNWLNENFPQLRAEQFLIRGYGESQSIADNSTAEGRALNRRVEFKVLNREVLRHEVPLNPEEGSKIDRKKP